jgi:hypothetical protein
MKNVLVPNVSLRRDASGSLRASAHTSKENFRTLVSIEHAKEISMLYTIAVVLLILWALGLVSAYTMGGFIHVLLVIAVVVVLLRVISGRRVV